MSSHNEEPIPAQLADAPPRRSVNRSRLWIVIVAGGLCCLGCCGGGVWALVLLTRAAQEEFSRVAEARRSAREAMAAAAPESIVTVSLEEDSAALRRGFDGAAHTETPEFDAIQAYLEDLLTVGHDHDTLVQKIDWPRRMAYYYRVYVEQPVNPFRRIELQALARKDAKLPSPLSGPQVMHVDQLSEHEYLAYVYCDEGDGELSPYRFRLSKYAVGWKLIDWQDVGYGMWNAELESRQIGTDANLQQRAFGRAIEDLIRADNLLGENKLPEATAALVDAERHDIPPPLRDFLRYALAGRYLRTDARQTLRLTQAGRGDSVPFIYKFAAQAHASMGDTAAALEMLEKYRRAAGFHPDVESHACQYHRLRKETAAAAEIALRLLRFQPDHPSYVAQAVGDVTPDQRAIALGLLHDTEGNRNVVAGVAMGRMRAGDEAGFQQLRDFVAAHGTESSSALLLLDARKLNWEDRCEEAAALLRTGLAKVTDEETRETVQSLLVETRLRSESPLDVYRDAEQPRDMLQRLIGTDEYEDGSIDTRDFAAVLALHRERDPEDPRIPLYAGQLALREKQYARAVEELERAREADGVSEDEIKWALFSAYHTLGKSVVAYHSYGGTQEAYEMAAMDCRLNGDWDELRKLQAAHRERGGKHPRFLVEEAYLQAHDGDAQAAFNTVVEAAVADPSDNYQIQAAKRQLLVRLGRWREASEGSDDQLALAAVRRELEEEGDAAGLAELTELQRKIDADNVYFLRRQWDGMHSQAEHQAFVERYYPWPPPDLPQRISAQVYREQLVESLLFLERPDDALAVASQPTPDPNLQCLAHAGRGDAPALRALFQSDKEVEESFRTRLFGDFQKNPAVKKYRLDPQFAELRREFPAPPLVSWGQLRAVIFQSTSSEPPTVAELQRHFAAWGGEVTVHDVPGAPLEHPSFRIEIPGAVLCVTYGGSPLPLQKSQLARVPESTAEKVLQHQRWIDITQEYSTAEHSLKTRQFARAVAALLTDDASAVWFSGAAHEVLFPVEAETRERLIAGGPYRRMFPAATANVHLFVDDEDDDSQSLIRVRNQLKAAAAEFKPAEVIYRATQGGAREEHRLRVISVKHQGDGQYQVVAEYTQPSLLQPGVVPGDRVLLNRYTVHEYRETP